MDFHISFDADGPNITRLLYQVGEALTKLDTLLAQGAQLMAQDQETQQLLSEINQQTNNIADVLTAQAATIAEVQSDIDDLIARTTDTQTKADLTSLRDRLVQVGGDAQTQATQLQGIASQYTPPTTP